MRRGVWSIAPVSAAVVSVYVLSGPLVSTATESVAFGSSEASPPAPVRTESSSLLASQGSGVVLLVLIPILLATLPLLGPRPVHRRALGVAAVVLLAAYCVVGGMSIGAFYLPTLIILAITLAIESSTPLAPTR
jgi:hypothetical protein